MHSHTDYELGEFAPLTQPDRSKATTGIYIHFPYCIQKCSYCDFFSVAMQDRGNTNSVDENALRLFENTIKAELDARLKYFRAFSSADTVYFGGGTSSLMPPETIHLLISLLRSRIGLSPNCEITLEGNPENFTPQYLAALHQIGINRINVGIQTFDGDALKKMNRYFNADRYESILHDLEGSPIKNVGVDLIYGFPGQDVDAFYADLNKALSAELNHLSIYSLTAEAGTPYTTSIERRQASPPDEELQSRIFSELPDALARRGFQQYEISNFARLNGLCRHNLRYWNYESYMGLGPGAHGFTGTHRYANTRNIHAWTDAPAAAPYEVHNPIYDLPLNLLRLTIPIDPGIFDVVLGSFPGNEHLAAVARDLLQSWVERGFGRWENHPAPLSERSSHSSEGDSRTMFTWNFEGFSQLNDRTLEMIDKFENQI